MNRGTFVLISKDTKTNPLNPEYHIYKSQEFNGSMGLDSLGKNGYLELKNKVNSWADFYNFVKNFNDKYFQYNTKEFPICYETKDSKRKEIPLIYSRIHTLKAITIILNIFLQMMSQLKLPVKMGYLH